MVQVCLTPRLNNIVLVQEREEVDVLECSVIDSRTP